VQSGPAGDAQPLLVGKGPIRDSIGCADIDAGPARPALSLFLPSLGGFVRGGDLLRRSRLRIGPRLLSVSFGLLGVSNRLGGSGLGQFPFLGFGGFDLRSCLAVAFLTASAFSCSIYSCGPWTSSISAFCSASFWAA
jgi:hypothetical protein